MASDNDASCVCDPNFAVICSFLDKFALSCGIVHPSIQDLQEMLENSQEVSPQLIDLHVKLLRKSRKNVTLDKWEKSLIKFCHSYSSQDGWEIERFGYKKARLAVKLSILKTLLEKQFDSNSKFKTEINKLTADELRSQPIGRDKLGQTYWCQMDEDCNLRVYRENLDEETWDVVATDREGLLHLISQLSSDDPSYNGIDSALNEDSNSLGVEKPITDTGQVSEDYDNPEVEDSKDSEEDKEEEKCVGVVEKHKEASDEHGIDEKQKKLNDRVRNETVRKSISSDPIESSDDKKSLPLCTPPLTIKISSNTIVIKDKPAAKSSDRQQPTDKSDTNDLDRKVLSPDKAKIPEVISKSDGKPSISIKIGEKDRIEKIKIQVKPELGDFKPRIIPPAPVIAGSKGSTEPVVENIVKTPNPEIVNDEVKIPKSSSKILDAKVELKKVDRKSKVERLENLLQDKKKGEEIEPKLTSKDTKLEGIDMTCNTFNRFPGNYSSSKSNSDAHNSNTQQKDFGIDLSSKKLPDSSADSICDLSTKNLLEKVDQSSTSECELKFQLSNSNKSENLTTETTATDLSTKKQAGLVSARRDSGTVLLPRLENLPLSSFPCSTNDKFRDMMDNLNRGLKRNMSAPGIVKSSSKKVSRYREPVENRGSGTEHKPTENDKSCASVNENEDNCEVGEAIEEPLMLIRGEGSGRDCDAGNPGNEDDEKDSESKDVPNNKDNNTFETEKLSNVSQSGNDSVTDIVEHKVQKSEEKEKGSKSFLSNCSDVDNETPFSLSKYSFMSNSQSSGRYNSPHGVDVHGINFNDSANAKIKDSTSSPHFYTNNLLSKSASWGFDLAEDLSNKRSLPLNRQSLKSPTSSSTNEASEPCGEASESSANFSPTSKPIKFSLVSPRKSMVKRLNEFPGEENFPRRLEPLDFSSMSASASLPNSLLHSYQSGHESSIDRSKYSDKVEMTQQHMKLSLPVSETSRSPSRSPVMSRNSPVLSPTSERSKFLEAPLPVTKRFLHSSSNIPEDLSKKSDDLEKLSPVKNLPKLWSIETICAPDEKLKHMIESAISSVNKPPSYQSELAQTSSSQSAEQRLSKSPLAEQFLTESHAAPPSSEKACKWSLGVQVIPKSVIGSPAKRTSRWDVGRPEMEPDHKVPRRDSHSETGLVLNVDTPDSPHSTANKTLSEETPLFSKRSKSRFDLDKHVMAQTKPGNKNYENQPSTTESVSQNERLSVSPDQPSEDNQTKRLYENIRDHRSRYELGTSGWNEPRKTDKSIYNESGKISFMQKECQGTIPRFLFGPGCLPFSLENKESLLASSASNIFINNLEKNLMELAVQKTDKVHDDKDLRSSAGKLSFSIDKMMEKSVRNESQRSDEPVDYTSSLPDSKKRHGDEALPNEYTKHRVDDRIHREVPVSLSSTQSDSAVKTDVSRTAASSYSPLNLLKSHSETETRYREIQFADKVNCLSKSVPLDLISKSVLPPKDVSFENRGSDVNSTADNTQFSNPFLADISKVKSPFLGKMPTKKPPVSNFGKNRRKSVESITMGIMIGKLGGKTNLDLSSKITESILDYQSKAGTILGGQKEAFSLESTCNIPETQDARVVGGTAESNGSAVKEVKKPRTLESSADETSSCRSSFSDTEVPKYVSDISNKDILDSSKQDEKLLLKDGGNEKSSSVCGPTFSDGISATTVNLRLPPDLADNSSKNKVTEKDANIENKVVFDESGVENTKIESKVNDKEKVVQEMAETRSLASTGLPLGASSREKKSQPTDTSVLSEGPWKETRVSETFNNTEGDSESVALSLSVSESGEKTKNLLENQKWTDTEKELSENQAPLARNIKSDDKKECNPVKSSECDAAENHEVSNIDEPNSDKTDKASLSASNSANTDVSCVTENKSKETVSKKADLEIKTVASEINDSCAAAVADCMNLEDKSTAAIKASSASSESPHTVSESPQKVSELDKLSVNISKAENFLKDDVLIPDTKDKSDKNQTGVDLPFSENSIEAGEEKSMEKKSNGSKNNDSEFVPLNLEIDNVPEATEKTDKLDKSQNKIEHKENQEKVKSKSVSKKDSARTHPEIAIKTVDDNDSVALVEHNSILEGTVDDAKKSKLSNNQDAQNTSVDVPDKSISNNESLTNPTFPAVPDSDAVSAVPSGEAADCSVKPSKPQNSRQKKAGQLISKGKDTVIDEKLDKTPTGQSSEALKPHLKEIEVCGSASGNHQDLNVVFKASADEAVTADKVESNISVKGLSGVRKEKKKNNKKETVESTKSKHDISKDDEMGINKKSKVAKCSVSEIQDEVKQTSNEKLQAEIKSCTVSTTDKLVETKLKTSEDIKTLEKVKQDVKSSETEKQDTKSSETEKQDTKSSDTEKQIKLSETSKSADDKVESKKDENKDKAESSQVSDANKAPEPVAEKPRIFLKVKPPSELFAPGKIPLFGFESSVKAMQKEPLKSPVPSKKEQPALQKKEPTILRKVSVLPKRAVDPLQIEADPLRVETDPLKIDHVEENQRKIPQNTKISKIGDVTIITAPPELLHSSTDLKSSTQAKNSKDLNTELKGVASTSEQEANKTPTSAETCVVGASAKTSPTEKKDTKTLDKKKIGSKNKSQKQDVEESDGKSIFTRARTRLAGKLRMSAESETESQKQPINSETVTETVLPNEKQNDLPVEKDDIVDSTKSAIESKVSSKEDIPNEAKNTEKLVGSSESAETETEKTVPESEETVPEPEKRITTLQQLSLDFDPTAAIIIPKVPPRPKAVPKRGKNVKKSPEKSSDEHVNENKIDLIPEKVQEETSGACEVKLDEVVETVRKTRSGVRFPATPEKQTTAKRKLKGNKRLESGSEIEFDKGEAEKNEKDGETEELDSEVGGKRRKTRLKRQPDMDLRRSVEEQKLREGAVSSSEDDQRDKILQPEAESEVCKVDTEVEKPQKGKKQKPKPKPKSPKGKSRAKQKPVDEHTDSPVPTSETQLDSTQASPRKTASAKTNRMLQELDIEVLKELSKIDEGSGPRSSIRQSRRIAQIKIKEQAERRDVPMFVIDESQSRKRKEGKKKREEKHSKSVKGGDVEKKHKKKKKKQPHSDEDFKLEEKEDDELKKKLKKKRKRGSGKIKFNELNPWISSSGSSSDQEDEEEEEEIYEPEPVEDENLVFKSDHEFSPESDLEDDKDEDYQPTRRARTAQKDSGDEDSVDEYACQKCNKSDHPEWILLCDKCDQGWHGSCLRPALLVIPEGDWFCPPCEHKTLISHLEERLMEFDRISKRRENEELRRKRLAYVGISLENVLPTKDKEKTRDGSEGSEEESGEGSSSSDSGSSSSDESEPVYQLRERRQALFSYRFNEYDDLINSAIQDEMEAVKGAGNQGRGKDIANIVNAEKQEMEERRKREMEKKLENGEYSKAEGEDANKGGENEEEEDEEEEEPDGYIPPVKPKYISIGRKKHRRLNALDITSEEDNADSDEDFKGTSSEEEEEEADYSDDSEDGVPSSRRKNLPVRRSSRARTTRFDKEFINDDSDESDAPRRKKTRRVWDESESEESDTWGRSKKRKSSSRRSISRRSKSKKKKKKKKQRDSDENEGTDIVKEKKPKKRRIKYGGLDSLDNVPIMPRTRGKKMNYQELAGSDSEEEIKKIIQRKEKSDEEFVADMDEEDEEEEEEIEHRPVIEDDDDEEDGEQEQREDRDGPDEEEGHDSNEIVPKEKEENASRENPAPVKLKISTKLRELEEDSEHEEMPVKIKKSKKSHDKKSKGEKLHTVKTIRVKRVLTPLLSEEEEEGEQEDKDENKNKNEDKEEELNFEEEQERLDMQARTEEEEEERRRILEENDDDDFLAEEELDEEEEGSFINEENEDYDDDDDDEEMQALREAELAKKAAKEERKRLKKEAKKLEKKEMKKRGKLARKIEEAKAAAAATEAAMCSVGLGDIGPAGRTAKPPNPITVTSEFPTPVCPPASVNSVVQNIQMPIDPVPLIPSTIEPLMQTVTPVSVSHRLEEGEIPMGNTFLDMKPKRRGRGRGRPPLVPPPETPMPVPGMMSGDGMSRFAGPQGFQQPLQAPHSTGSVITRMLQSQPVSTGAQSFTAAAAAMGHKYFGGGSANEQPAGMSPQNRLGPGNMSQPLPPPPQYGMGSRGRAPGAYRQPPPPLTSSSGNPGAMGLPSHYVAPRGSPGRPPLQQQQSMQHLSPIRMRAPPPGQGTPMFHTSHHPLDPSPSGGGPIVIAPNTNSESGSPHQVLPPSTAGSPVKPGHSTPPPYIRGAVPQSPMSSLQQSPNSSVPPPLVRFPMQGNDSSRLSQFPASQNHPHQPSPSRAPPGSSFPPYHPHPQSYHYGGYPPPPLSGADSTLAPMTYPDSSYPDDYSTSDDGSGAHPTDIMESKTYDDEVGGEFGGLVSYFSSQREDDLDA